MKILILTLCFLNFSVLADAVTESVYVESPTDTDQDGQKDRIYVSINRPESERKLSTVYEISPYSGGANSVTFHNVDSEYLPQDSKNKRMSSDAFVHASLKAHSLGTGKSTGCPSVGDESEILAAKAVIDWLNGRAKAWSENGNEVTADWANGNVGMTGVSYNGTLPIMVASTGVEGLKAIAPIAAISNWYDYYRANGLVVNPSGYIGEDADILGYYVVRRGHCQSAIERLTRTMGREHGDFTPFWQARNHLANAKKFKAATFIIHGQSDWNVKQKHAIQLWEALDGVVPRRMILHRGGHGIGSAFKAPEKVKQWFAHFLDGEENGIEKGPLVEVEHMDGTSSTQEKWPHERARKERFYLASQNTLSKTTPAFEEREFTDLGKTKKLEELMAFPDEDREGRLFFLSEPFTSERIFTGTPKVHLKLAVKNRRAANLTVAIVYYNQYGKRYLLTRGWADPQNHKNVRSGEKLVPGKYYDLVFDIEPKQAKLAQGGRIGVIVASTDYEFTLRPDAGTILQVALGEESYVEMMLTP